MYLKQPKPNIKPSVSSLLYIRNVSNASKKETKKTKHLLIKQMYWQNLFSYNEWPTINLITDLTIKSKQ